MPIPPKYLFWRAGQGMNQICWGSLIDAPASRAIRPCIAGKMASKMLIPVVGALPTEFRYGAASLFIEFSGWPFYFPRCASLPKDGTQQLKEWTTAINLPPAQVLSPPKLNFLERATPLAMRRSELMAVLHALQFEITSERGSFHFGPVFEKFPESLTNHLILLMKSGGRTRN